MDNKQDKGFTLVELLIVIVILGILATVTVFAVRGITKNAQSNSCDVEKRTIETAIEAHYADGGAPLTDDDFAGLSGYLKEDAATLTSDWDFTYGTASTEATVTAVPGGACADAVAEEG